MAEDAAPPAEPEDAPMAEDDATPPAEDNALLFKEIEPRVCYPPFFFALRDAPPPAEEDAAPMAEDDAPPPEDDEPSTEAAAAAEESPLRAIRSACSDLQAQLGAMIASFDDLDAAPLTLSL